MAFSRFDRYRYLNEWREFMLEDIWKFNQVNGDIVPKTTCDVYIQRDRDTIARALTRAVGMATPYLGTYPRPTYVTGEVRELAIGRRPWGTHPLKTRWGHVQALGSRAVTELPSSGAGGQAVVYSEAYGTGGDDLATISLTLADAADATEDEIRIFFRTGDGAPSAAHPDYEIEPITVVKNGTSVTITADRALFVKPSEHMIPYERLESTDSTLEKHEVSSANGSNGFVTLVDVYRVYTDSTGAVTLISTGTNCNCLADTETALTAQINNSELGRIGVACPTCSACIGYPHRVRINYLAGFPLVDRRPDFTLTEAMVHLANASIPRIEGAVCDQKDNAWNEDYELAHNTPGSAASNPFGIRNGHNEAWRIIQIYALIRGGLIDA